MNISGNVGKARDFLSTEHTEGHGKERQASERKVAKKI
jgi:hypothetical protein